MGRIEIAIMDFFFFFQKFDYNEEKRDSALAAGELC